MNNDVMAFNPAPFIGLLIVVAAFGLTYQRTRSVKRAGVAVLVAIASMAAFVVIIHLLGFE